MGKSTKPVVKRSLFSWIFYKNVKLQMLLIGIIFVTVFTRVLPLEIQKRIINEAIYLNKVDMLMKYCAFYFLLVVLSSILKYIINVIQTLISQKSTSEMRKDLYHHILKLPLFFFRSTHAGTIVNALINELTIPGNFIGMSVAIPVSNILTLIAFAVYLFWLNSLLACVTLLIYPIVIFLIPLLQRKANKANKKRVKMTRVLSSKIAESITGIHEIQSNGAYEIENRKFDGFVDKLLKIRISWSLFRFGIKSMNNFFISLGPFLVFLLGGYLTIQGKLELGALVAFLSAQEKLYDPWRELIEFYEVYQEGKVNYDRTMESFDVEPDHSIHSDDGNCKRLDSDVAVQELSFSTSDGIQLLSGISFFLESGEHMALVGFSGSGKSTLAQCIIQLYKYTEGVAKIGGQEVATLSKMDISSNTGFVSQSPFIFDGTIEDNLMYAVRAIENENKSCQFREEKITLDDMISVIQQTGMFIDVLTFGLNTVIAHESEKDLKRDILKVRRKLKTQYDEEFREWVEFYAEERYLEFSSIAENILLGVPLMDSFKEDNLIYNPFFLSFLKENKLEERLFFLGKFLCLNTVDILKNLPREEIFYKQSPIHAHEFDTYQAIALLLKKRAAGDLPGDMRSKILAIALRFIPGRHKIVPLSDNLKDQILEARWAFRNAISDRMVDAISFYHMDQYFDSQTILNNILFGNTKITNPETDEQIHQFIIRLLIEEDLLERIVEIGMQYKVGVNGDNLSGGQRQKLSIARALLKKPKVLILDEATSALDNKSQARIQNYIEHHLKGKSTVIAVVHRLDNLRSFDKIAVMKAGKLVEMGPYDELIQKKGVLYELEFGKR